MLAIDAVLAALIGSTPNSMDVLIRKAAKGEITLIVEQLALYCALSSVREEDSLNIKRFADLLKYARIQQDVPEDLGSMDRESWTPSDAEIENWRRCALDLY
jgi:hypothetical protein